SSEQKKSATPAFLSLETLNFLDPAVGSGHILVEAFDTYYPMYLAEFYNPEEAVQSILQNNLFGLDLDTRAAQLAQFAIIIKAAKCSRTVLQGKILPHVYAMPQPRFFTKEEVEIFLGDAYISIIDELYEALQIMEQANNLGSIMILKLSDAAHKAIQERDYYWQTTQTQTLEEEIVKETFSTYINILIILTNEFVCIAANPPYMGQKNMNASLKSYVNKNYPLTKSDLFAVFMDVTTNLAKENGRHGIINMQSWMFLSSYEKLREELIKNQTIESMLHLGPRTFEELSGEVVQNTSFILKKTLPNNSCGVYYRLVEYGSNDLKKEAFRNKSNEFADIYQLNFLKITGYPIAYWITEAGLKCFEEHQAIKEIMKAAVGLNTGDNDVFLKLWPEIDFDKIDFKRTSIEDAQLSKSKWFPYNKGGGFKKWYGNLYYVLNWFNDGKEVKEFAVLRNDGKHWSRYIQNLHYMFKDGITWSDIVSNSFAARYTPKGSLFDVKGSSGFTYSEEDLLAVLSVFCSKLSSYFVKAVNPTITVQVGDLSRIPLPQMILKNYRIKSFASSCIELTKSDWDSRENSWDFRANPLILSRQKTLELSSIYWIKQISKNFFQLHSHEEELNKILINIYDLSSELSCDVSLNDITVLQDELDFQRLAQLRRPYENQLVPIRVHTIMQQLISYAVGCYMGRYRLDRPGLYIAHPSPTEEELLPYALSKDVNKHFLFQIDDDAIIPLMGSNGNFTDDMLHRTKEFLSIVWGNDTLTANLNFLQQQLGKDLEDYLLKDFWKDHVKTYSKKPIYWLFASKKGAFQVLVYMHRMNAYTPANIRSKYLIPHISWLKSQLIDMGKKAATLSKAELKKLDILRKQAAECEEYDLLLKDLADKQISFDLDDGVTKNYALFEGVVAPIK
ncbi:MAG: BREX-1 system adenine-specific DNA-methyltransferase PglX, partial [Ferruginibacter sp.]